MVDDDPGRNLYAQPGMEGMMAVKRCGFPRWAMNAVLATAVFGLVSCGDDNPVDPGGGAGTIVVTSALELDQALMNSVAGDTLDIRAEFSSPTFTMTKGYSIPASRSPITIQGTPKAGFLRPEIVFPSGVVGITLTGHAGSVIKDLDFRGGSDVISLLNSSVVIQGIVVRNNTGDGVAATGSGSSGTVTLCLFDHPGRSGVSTGPGASVMIVRNTVIHAGDSGIRVGSNATLLSNNIYDAQNFGIFCDDHATNPTIRCNNAFLSLNGNFACASVTDIAETNAQLNPRFCPGGYRLSETSPLIDAGECGQIGALGAEPGCRLTE